MYDGDRWTEMESLNEKRSDHSACTYDKNCIYVFGGENSNLEALGSIEIYRKETRKW